MKKVVRYQCEWCGKEFKTPDRHKCRWSPEAHNCLSCKHRGKRVDDDITEYGDKWYGFECPYFEDPCEAPCDFAKGAVSKEGNNCPHWEQVENYKGKKSFAEIESERDLAENPGEFKDLAEFHSACERGREASDASKFVLPF